MTDYSYSSQAPWKDNRDSIVSVVIGNGVSSLGDYAFYYCKKMTNISISNTVTRIGDSTFQSTALSRISFPDSLRTIDSFAFYNCSSLTEVTIPANITNIESYAFDICTGLRSITVASGNANYCSENGVLYNKSKTELLRYPCNSGATSFTVPESVSSIDVGAFGNNQTLTSVTISGSKVNIWGFSFDKCVALRSVTVLGDVGNIGGNAFRGCSALTDLTFKGNAPTIRDTAFTDDTITISYPANNSTWAETIQDSYGGNITWRAS